MMTTDQAVAFLDRMIEESRKMIKKPAPFKTYGEDKHKFSFASRKIGEISVTLHPDGGVIAEGRGIHLAYEWHPKTPGKTLPRYTLIDFSARGQKHAATIGEAIAKVINYVEEEDDETGEGLQAEIAGQRQDQEEDQHKEDQAAGAVAPVDGVRPRREGSD
jgi:hypothetical protein